MCGYQTRPGSTFNLVAAEYPANYIGQALELVAKVARCAAPGSATDTSCSKVDSRYTIFRQSADEIVGMAINQPLGAASADLNNVNSSTRFAQVAAGVRTGNVLCASFGVLVGTDPMALHALQLKIAHAVETLCHR